MNMFIKLFLLSAISTSTNSLFAQSLKIKQLINVFETDISETDDYLSTKSFYLFSSNQESDSKEAYVWVYRPGQPIPPKRMAVLRKSNQKGKSTLQYIVYDRDIQNTIENEIKSMNIPRKAAWTTNNGLYKLYIGGKYSYIIANEIIKNKNNNNLSNAYILYLLPNNQLIDFDIPDTIKKNIF